MSAFMRGVTCLISAERNAFLTRRCDIKVSVESKRYVRGLRRKPTRVILPEDVKPPPEFDQPAAAESLKKQKRANVTSAAETPEDPAVKKPIQSFGKHVQVTAAKDQVDGLRFERAFPGDKRLA